MRFVPLIVMLLLVMGLFIPFKSFSFGSQTLKYGSSGGDVYELQGRLSYLGYYTGSIDGIFGWPNTSAYNAAKDAANGWDPSGGALYYFNPKTATSAWNLEPSADQTDRQPYFYQVTGLL